MERVRNFTDSLIGRVISSLTIITFCYGIIVGIGNFVGSVKANTQARITSANKVEQILVNQKTIIIGLEVMSAKSESIEEQQGDIIKDIDGIHKILMER